MEHFYRRSLIGLGIAASTVALPLSAPAQGAEKQLAPGVKQIDYGERDSLIPRLQKNQHA